MNGFEFPAFAGNQAFNDQINRFWQSNLMAQLDKALFLYSQIRLKRTVSVQQIFQSLVRNKQFKFSRVFEIKTNLVELAELKKRAKI